MRKGCKRRLVKTRVERGHRRTDESRGRSGRVGRTVTAAGVVFGNDFVDGRGKVGEEVLLEVA